MFSLALDAVASRASNLLERVDENELQIGMGNDEVFDLPCKLLGLEFSFVFFSIRRSIFVEALHVVGSALRVFANGLRCHLDSA